MRDSCTAVDDLQLTLGDHDRPRNKVVFLKPELVANRFHRRVPAASLRILGLLTTTSSAWSLNSVRCIIKVIAARVTHKTKRSQTTISTMDTEVKKEVDIAQANDIRSRTSHREHERNTSGHSNDQPSGRPVLQEHGPLIDRSPTAELISRGAVNTGLLWPRIRHHLREPFSEFMGTFILIMFGDGVVAQVVLSKDKAGDYQSISWGWVSCLSIL